jgi:hypothetical protein
MGVCWVAGFKADQTVLRVRNKGTGYGEGIGGVALVWGGSGEEDELPHCGRKQAIVYLTAVNNGLIGGGARQRTDQRDAAGDHSDARRRILMHQGAQAVRG